MRNNTLFMLSITTKHPEIFLGEGYEEREYEETTFNMNLPTFSASELKDLEEEDGGTLLESNWEDTIITFKKRENGEVEIFVEFESRALNFGFPLYDKFINIEEVSSVEVYMSAAIGNSFGYQGFATELYFDIPEFFTKGAENIVLVKEKFDSFDEREVYEKAFEMLYGESSFLTEDEEERYRGLERSWG